MSSNFVGHDWNSFLMPYWVFNPTNYRMHGGLHVGRGLLHLSVIGEEGCICRRNKISSHSMLPFWFRFSFFLVKPLVLHMLKANSHCPRRLKMLQYMSLWTKQTQLWGKVIGCGFILEYFVPIKKNVWGLVWWIFQPIPSSFLRAWHAECEYLNFRSQNNDIINNKIVPKL